MKSPHIDIRTKEKYKEVLAHLDDITGRPSSHFFYLNDSLKGMGVRVDRHASIDQGAIGKEEFRFSIKSPRLVDITKVIETPNGSYGEDFDGVYLALLIKLLIEDS